MDVKLSAEQRRSLRAQPGEPLRVLDDQTAKAYFLVEEASLLHLEAAADEQSAPNVERLRELIRFGDASPDVSAAEVFADLRRRAADLSKRPPT